MTPMPVLLNRCPLAWAGRKSSARACGLAACGSSHCRGRFSPAIDRGITFDELGQVDAAIVSIEDGRRCWSLLTSPSTGRVSIQEGAVEVLPTDRVDLDNE